MLKTIYQDITEHKKYTGKTVITLAIAKWLMGDVLHNGEGLVDCLRKLCRKYFKVGYEDSFKAWIHANDNQHIESLVGEPVESMNCYTECFYPIVLYALSLDEAKHLAGIATNAISNDADFAENVERYVRQEFLYKTTSELDNGLDSKLDKLLPADLRVIMDVFEKKADPKKPTYNSYKVNDWLWAGEYPSDRHEELAIEKLRQFKRFGITNFIDLTEEGELSPYSHLLGKDVCYTRFPITDQSVPKSLAGVRELVEGIIEKHTEKPEAKFYIHCWGGVGRTGVIVACFLACYNTLNYGDTIKELTRLFEDCPKSDRRTTPENSDQFNFIKDFIDYMNKRYTPDRITSLRANEVFVFGSNLAGQHMGGAARLAFEKFGAIWGQGVGLQGQSYAIPTMQGGTETIKPYVDEFIAFAEEHSTLNFLVTKIGCGIAGFRDEEIAPLFTEATEVDNIVLPRDFVDIIYGKTKGNPFDLQRFIEAQEHTYDLAIEELNDGQKRSHWIWWIFPQLAILGRSSKAKYYGLSGYDEAEAYLNHPVLGKRLREATNALLLHKELSPVEIFGELDAMKVKSSMTLFDAVSPEDIFEEVIQVFYNGAYDKKTLEWM